jgi:hypothetical protein
MHAVSVSELLSEQTQLRMEAIKILGMDRPRMEKIGAALREFHTWANREV